MGQTESSTVNYVTDTIYYKEWCLTCVRVRLGQIVVSLVKKRGYITKLQDFQSQMIVLPENFWAFLLENFHFSHDKEQNFGQKLHGHFLAKS